MKYLVTRTCHWWSRSCFQFGWFCRHRWQVVIQDRVFVLAPVYHLVACVHKVNIYTVLHNFLSVILWQTLQSESRRYVPKTNYISFSCLFRFAKMWFNPPNPPGLPTRLGFFAGIGRRAAGGPAMMKWELKLQILQAGINSPPVPLNE